MVKIYATAPCVEDSAERKAGSCGVIVGIGEEVPAFILKEGIRIKGLESGIGAVLQ